MKGESELFSLKILNLEKRICLQNLIHLRREIFLQNLEFREENENFFFKILTIKIISRNENSILQRKRNISSRDFLKVENLVNAVAARFVWVLRESCWMVQPAMN